MRRLSHAQYYQDRSSEYELCNDFPADEILIEGLHLMQSHFRANHVAIDIPVVRVMNAAHFIASYMFNTECSGDQLEYDVLAHESIGRDKQLVPLTMIVVAAMLKRTDGGRARQCRNLILDNRDPDFEEGVTLYDRFLQSSEKHFAEEDFLIDTHSQIIQLQEENEKLAAENLQLKYTISTMGNKQNNQFNNCVIINAPLFSTTTTNNNFYQQPSEASKTEPVQDEKNDTAIVHFPFLTQKCYEEQRVELVEAEIRAACKGTAEALWRALWNNENLGYVEVEHIDATTLYRTIENWYGQLPYKERNFRDARKKR